MELQRIFTPEYVNQLVNDINPDNYKGDIAIYNENEVRRLKGVEKPVGLLERMLNATDEYEAAIHLYEAYKSSGNSALFWDVCKSRFRITDTIKPLSPLKLKNSFCSIIIEARNKKKILKDLSYIGFGVDYIYPELEYTAKEIKRRLE